jgi:hypothetical protein
VATVGAASLSLIVPVAEAVPGNVKSRYFHQSYQQLLVHTVPVVAGTVTVCEVVV